MIIQVIGGNSALNQFSIGKTTDYQIVSSDLKIFIRMCWVYEKETIVNSII